jgi:hypothetical protein
VRYGTPRDQELMLLGGKQHLLKFCEAPFVPIEGG